VSIVPVAGRSAVSAAHVAAMVAALTIVIAALVRDPLLALWIASPLIVSPIVVWAMLRRAGIRGFR
jgi:hypothetical protein